MYYLVPFFSIKVINPQVFGGGERIYLLLLICPQQIPIDLNSNISEKHADFLLAIKALNLLPAFIF